MNESKLKNEHHISIQGKKYKKKFPEFDLHLDDAMTEELTTYGYMVVMDAIFDNKISKYMGTLVIIFIKIMETEFVDQEY